MGFYFRIAIISNYFRIFRFHSGVFPNDFKSGANEADILTCVKDIFSECFGIFSG